MNATWDDDIPNIWKKTCSSHHQLAIDTDIVEIMFFLNFQESYWTHKIILQIKKLESIELWNLNVELSLFEQCSQNIFVYISKEPRFLYMLVRDWFSTKCWAFDRHGSTRCPCHGMVGDWETCHGIIGAQRSARTRADSVGEQNSNIYVYIYILNWIYFVDIEGLGF